MRAEWFTDNERPARRAAGYLLDVPGMAAPSVYALNQRAASMLTTELLNYVCAFRPTATMILESWREARIQRADRSNFPEMPDPECPVCGFYAGALDTEPLPRPTALQGKVDTPVEAGLKVVRLSSINHDDSL